MRASAVVDLLERCDADWATVDELVNAGELKQVTYRDQDYYVRRWQ